ncbi:MAG: ABC transporter ATP-binding protein [Chloroflexota bacterium]
MGMMLDGNRRLLDQDVRRSEDLWRTIARFGRYFRPYWIGLLLVLVFILAGAWATVTAPDLLGQAVDCYIAPNPQNPNDCWYTTVELNASSGDRIAGLGELVLLVAGLFVLDAAMVGAAFYTMRWTGQNVIRDIRAHLFSKIQQLSMGYYARNEAGDVMSRVTNDIDTVQQMFNFALLNVVRGVFLIGSIVLAMIRINLPYALFSLATVPVMLFMTIYFSNQARRAFRRARKEIGNVNADLQESISGAREVQAFNREEESIANFVRGNEANREANVRAAMFTSALGPSLEAVTFIALGIVVLVGGLSALRNEPLLGTAVISLGTIIAFITYLQRLNQPVQQIAILWANVQNGIAGGERIFGLIDEAVDIQDKPDAQPMPPIKGAVSLENVWAEYVPGEPVLRGVDLEVHTGEMVAVVGPTGAGKTTLINLIPRFYDVTQGAVRIDGSDVRDVTQASLREQIGIVLQDTFLFSDTVMENIRYGRLDATDEEVIAAAKMVAAHDFIERLPDSYQTRLGERGGGLSQGQRQLIAIARVALMNPHILILDEATSSVDTRTERVIQAAFEKLLAGRTSFVIAHRLSTIRNADQVLVVQDGVIVERGTHQSLLAERGAYYALYMSQFKEEEEIV